jgi:hypothetical protein
LNEPRATSSISAVSGFSFHVSRHWAVPLREQLASHEILGGVDEQHALEQLAASASWLAGRMRQRLNQSAEKLTAQIARY